jgi:hypothetical protein
MRYAPISYNRSVYDSPQVGGLGYVLASLRSFPRLTPPKRHKQPERYAQLGLKFVGKSLKNDRQKSEKM